MIWHKLWSLLLSLKSSDRGSSYVSQSLQYGVNKHNRDQAKTRRETEEGMTHSPGRMGEREDSEEVILQLI